MTVAMSVSGPELPLGQEFTRELSFCKAAAQTHDKPLGRTTRSQISFLALNGMSVRDRGLRMLCQTAVSPAGKLQKLVSVSSREA
jgi:hypothetical protein